MSGKKKQNTIKATAVSDGDGRLLWLGAFRPGRMHDVTALRTDGIEDLLRHHPEVQPKSMRAIRAWPVTSPPRSAPRRRNPARTRHPRRPRAGSSSATGSPPSGYCIEHAIAEPKQWRSMQRWIGRREYFEHTALAIAGLVSDRAAAR